jgi:hypothetical protein
MYLVKQLYDLLNYEQAENGDPRAESEVGAAWTPAALASRKGKAA